MWLALTLLMVGDLIARQHALAMSVHEAVFQAKRASTTANQAIAEAEASKRELDFASDTDFGWELRTWIVLTLLGAALFAERRQTE
jgi:hypothetical protein